jgi:hypothetical protein
LETPRPWSRGGFRLSERCRLGYCQRLRVDAQNGRTVMAKGQKKSKREAKKPPASKKKILASDGSVQSVLVKPKRGAAAAADKK